MRILHMIPDIGISNGVMSVILNYFKAMPKDIVFDVIYFQQIDKDRKSDIEALGGRVFKIDAPSPKDLFQKKMERFFREHKGEWEALHIHAPHFVIFIAPWAKRAGIKKICCHCHSTWFSLYPKNELINCLLSLPAKKLTDYQFACGREAGEFWYKKNFFVLPNAVDCEKFRFDENKRKEVRESMGIGSSFVVGHVGRVDPPQKNHPFLMEVFANIKKSRPDAKLVLAGAEPTEELVSLAKTLEIFDDVMFLGARKDVDRLLQAFDVFVFPSFREGLPVSVVEAQAAGLPVIMSDAVTDEVIITDNVFSLPLSLSAEKWAEKVLSALELKREDTYSLMVKSGWDIFDCSRRLADYYRTGVYRDEQ